MEATIFVRLALMQPGDVNPVNHNFPSGPLVIEPTATVVEPVVLVGKVPN
jgi:hypothetical protein